MQIRPLVAAALGAALLYGATAPASAAVRTVPFEDGKRGFATRVPDTFKQNPPKPTGQAKYEAAEFYDDQAVYKSSGSSNPQFQIGWWVTPKTATTPGSATPPAPENGGDKPMARQDVEDAFGPKSFEEYIDQEIDGNTKLYGSNKPPMAERWASGKTGKTTKQRIDFKYLEINATKPKRKDDPQPLWYMFCAELTLERPAESVVVSFRGYCATQYAKDLGPVYLDIVKNFESHDPGGSTTTREEAPTDPDKYREWLKKTKLVAGWKAMDSPKKQYVLIYADGVPEKLVKQIADQIESLRGQVYEVVFPPDRPITAISVIRVCKDHEQYMAYHAPGGTAGYWSSYDKELVFYEDTSNKNDSLRVLYHEGFHQYIYYSVGACDPHSWFNEGHGDFFFGHNFKDGKWQLGKSLDRIGDAAKVKREKRVPPLQDWLHWSQDQYYGNNEAGLTGLENYALGWDLVYFLRTTKKPEYQGILQRYFDTLKGLVTAAHDERVKAREKAKAEGKDVGGGIEDDEELANRMHEDEWLGKALAAGFKGVDLDQLYKDWTTTIQ
jgi:hypothetical protein